MQAAVALDFTPAATHGHRGIGRYVRGLYGGLVGTDPAWVASNLGLLCASDDAEIGPCAARWSTAERTVRPADLFWPMRLVRDRWGLRSARYRIWHGTDPHAPRPPLRGAAAIETAYDLIPLRHRTPMTRFAHRRFFYRDYLSRLMSADIVLAISQTTAADVVETLGVPSTRVRVVPPVIDAPVPGTDADAPRNGDRLDLLYVGALVEHKRPELALEATAVLAAHGAEPVMRFAGLAPEPARTRLEARARELGLTSRVEILGPVGERELWAQLRRATVLLFPSAEEGFGIPPLEALAVGTPVVAADTPAARETLDGAALLVPPDGGAFAAAVERLVGDEALAARVRKAGAERAGRYSSGAVGRDLLAVYRELGA